jgi:DNA-binding Lrp family transcriptional regulator
MNIELIKTYDAKEAAKVLNVSESWVVKMVARAVQRGMIVEEGEKGSGKVLGSALIVIGRRFWQDYADECHWNAFNLKRAREQGRPIDEEEVA